MVTFLRLVNCGRGPIVRSTIPSIQTRSINNVALSYLEVVDKNVRHDLSPMLIFHGLFGSKTNWRSISKHLTLRTQRPIFAFDLRNHGDSPHVAGKESSLSAMASDIKLFMDDRGLDKAILLGHSLGGRVVSQFAFDWPDKVDKLILADISPLPRLPPAIFIEHDLFDALKQSVSSLDSGTSLNVARAQVSSQLMPVLKDKFVVDFFLLSLFKDTQTGRIGWRFNVDGLADFIESRQIYGLKCTQPFQGECLLIHGANSDYVRIDEYDQILQMLPQCKFVCLQGAGHYIHIEKSAQFMDAIVDFVQV